jgi:hypothetical protein
MSDIQRQTQQQQAQPSAVEAVKEMAQQVQVQVQAEVPRSVKLSETGKAVVEDIRRVAEDTQRLMEEKIEPAVAEAQAKVAQLEGKAGARAEAREGVEMVKAEIEALLRQLQEGGEDFLRLGKLLAYSTNFRHLLLDVTSILQDALKGDRVETETEETANALKVLTAKLQGKEVEQAKPSELSDKMVDELAEKFLLFLRRTHDVPEYRQAVGFLLDQANEIGSLSILSVALKERGELTRDEQKVYEAAQQSEAVKLAVRVKVFAEHWLDASLDPMIGALLDLKERLTSDEEAANQLRGLRKWLNSCLREPGFMEHLERRRSEFSTQLSQLRDRLYEHRGAYERLFEEVQFLGERLRKDELSVKLSEDLTELMNHLFRDASGGLTVKPELWDDLKRLMPVVLKQIRFITIPELVVHDEAMDFRASGITIAVGELAPKRIQAYFVSDLELPLRQSLTAESTESAPFDLSAYAEEYDLANLLVIEASRIYAGAKAIYFELEKRSFPTLTDSGLADLTIHGEDGMRLRLVFGARLQSGASTPLSAQGFHLLKATCEIDQLDLRLHETRHDWMYMVLGPLIKRRLRLRIQAEIEKALMAGDFVEQLKQPEKIVEAIKAAASPSQM